MEMARRRYLPFVRYTFPGFYPSRAHRFLAEKLEAFEAAVGRKESPRLMVFLPPRFGKSQLTSRQFPGWVLGRNPDWNVGIVSYGAELAEELSADARRIVLGDEYREVFGSVYRPGEGESVEIDRASTAVTHWRIAGRRGGVRAVGVGGALTGRGFEVLLIDDPIKGRKEADSELVRDDLWKWYQGTLRTRLEPGGGILLIQTRWHHDDLSGRLLEVDTQGIWDVVRLPALAEEDDPLGRAVGEPLDPNRFDLAALLALRDSPDGVSAQDWASQYQQSPTPDAGDVFRKDWFTNEPDPGGSGPLFLYLDTAYGKENRQRKGDRTAGGIWRVEATGYRLVHLYAARPSYPELKAAIHRLQGQWHAKAVVIEDHASGQSVLQDLRNETRLPVIGWKTRNESKLQRARAVAPLFESGRVKISLPQSQFEQYRTEHLQFPSGKYDDLVDMTSMALAHLGIYNHQKRRQTIVRDFRVEV